MLDSTLSYKKFPLTPFAQPRLATVQNKPGQSVTSLLGLELAGSSQAPGARGSLASLYGKCLPWISPPSHLPDLSAGAILSDDEWQNE